MTYRYYFTDQDRQTADRLLTAYDGACNRLHNAHQRSADRKEIATLDAEAADRQNQIGTHTVHLMPWLSQFINQIPATEYARMLRVLLE